MKIINLQAENIKKLTAVDITPQDSIVYVTGKNGAGKSSILDCITMALCGGKEIPKEPLKKGEEKGKITIDLGEYVVTRSFTSDNTYLKLEAKDGKKVGSPQKFLDQIVGEISFDPLEFLNHPETEQRRHLISLLKINVDELDKEEAELREERTITGRERDKAEGALKSITYHADITETEEVSPESILQEMRDKEEHNRKHEEAEKANEEKKSSAIRMTASIKGWQDQIIQLQKQIADAEADIEQLKVAYKAEKARLAEETVYDLADINALLSGVTARNAKIRDNITYNEKKQSFQSLQSDYDSFTKQIEDINKKRKDLLASAKMPVEGLTFDTNGLIYNDIPLKQCSDGEKLMVSLSISMALNPDLKVLRVKDGSLLDNDNRTIISEVVKDKGYQLWFETVGDSSSVGIFIEEGEIKMVDGKPVEKHLPPVTKSRAKKKDKADKPEETVQEVKPQQDIPQAPWEDDQPAEKPKATNTATDTDDDW